MRTLNDYFAAVAAIVEREGGVIHQFMGDAILVTFNTARPHPDHAAAALRTALGIEALANGTRFGPGVLCRTRSGVNTGDVVAGAVGTRDRLLFTVYGDEVNIACRLEQLNKDHGTYILASEQTMAAAGQGFSGQPMGAIPVKGRSQPVQVFAVKPG
jgi:adenylate cyclase